MGDKNFMGGLLGGLAQGMQQQQELTLKKEYQKSLIDINKLHGKLFEAQVNASDLETSVLKNALEKAGVLGAGTAPQGEMAQAPTPQPNMWGAGSQGGVSQSLPATGPPARDFSDRFMEGYLKKKWGMEPDEVLVKPYGDHLGVFSKKSGTLLGVYPGQGKTVMQDITLPGGAKAVQPMLQPPVPPGPGVPVFGGGQGLPQQPPALGQGGGGYNPMLTAPRPFKYEQSTEPGGGIVQKVVPQSPLPGEEVRTGPPKGANAAEAGRMQLAQSGLDAHKQLENLIFDAKTGKSNWGTLAANIGPGVPWTEGKQIKGLIMRSADAIIRAATGAALNQQELEGYAEMYGPSVFDNEATIQSKMKGLRTFLNGYLEKMDPTEAARMRIGPIVGDIGKGDFNAPKQNKVPSGAKPTNRTSGGKPVYQLTDGRYWVE